MATDAALNGWGSEWDSENCRDLPKATQLAMSREGAQICLTPNTCPHAVEEGT